MSEIDGSAEQRLERTEAEQLVEDVANQVVALGETERRALLLALEHAANDRPQLGLGVFTLDLRQPIEVQPVQQLLMDPSLECLIFRVPYIGSSGNARGRPQ